jgi:hypothetical protein
MEIDELFDVVAPPRDNMTFEAQPVFDPLTLPENRVKA